jgi:hypothetical protein
MADDFISLGLDKPSSSEAVPQPHYTTPVSHAAPKSFLNKAGGCLVTGLAGIIVPVLCQNLGLALPLSLLVIEFLIAAWLTKLFLKEEHESLTSTVSLQTMLILQLLVSLIIALIFLPEDVEVETRYIVLDVVIVLIGCVGIFWLAIRPSLVAVLAITIYHIVVVFIQYDILKSNDLTALQVIPSVIITALRLLSIFFMYKGLLTLSQRGTQGDSGPTVSAESTSGASASATGGS